MMPALFHHLRPAGLLAPALVLLTLAQPAAAQMSGSIKVGVSAATFRGETTLDYTPKYGWTGSFGLGYDFGNGFAIVPELIYLVKGAETETTGAYVAALLGDEPSPGAGDIDVHLERQLTYAEVPVLVYYRLETRSGFHPRVFAGPSFGYKLNARLRFRAEGDAAEFDQADPSIEQVEYGIVAGFGAEVDTGGERLTVDLRTHVGRSNIRDTDPAVTDPAVAGRGAGRTRSTGRRPAAGRNPGRAGAAGASRRRALRGQGWGRQPRGLGTDRIRLRLAARLADRATAAGTPAGDGRVPGRTPRTAQHPQRQLRHPWTARARGGRRPRGRGRRRRAR